MKEKKERKDEFIYLRIGKNDKENLRSYCKKNNTTMSKLIFSHLTSILG